jgi:uncharacterized membrane protein YwzB
MLAVAVVVQLWTFQHLGQGVLVVQVVAVAVVILMELLERRVQLIQVAVVAVELISHKVTAVMAVQGLSSFVTNQQLKKARVAQSLLLVVITTTPSHLLALTQHKGKTHVTFCKSSRRHRYTSYRC